VSASTRRAPPRRCRWPARRNRRRRRECQSLPLAKRRRSNPKARPAGVGDRCRHLRQQAAPPMRCCLGPQHRPPARPLCCSPPLLPPLPTSAPVLGLRTRAPRLPRKCLCSKRRAEGVLHGRFTESTYIRGCILARVSGGSTSGPCTPTGDEAQHRLASRRPWRIFPHSCRSDWLPGRLCTHQCNPRGWLSACAGCCIVTPS
jgi:hypothetical protein